MTVETIDVLLADGRVVPARLSIAHDTQWSVQAEGEGLPAEPFVGRDVFDAVAELRRAIEPAGHRLLIAGACADTIPSGMSRDMGAGRGVYRVTLGQGASSPPVDMFAPASADEVGTVAEQSDYRRRWTDSLRALR